MHKRKARWVVAEVAAVIFVSMAGVAPARAQNATADRAKSVDAALHKAIAEGNWESAIELGHELVTLRPDAPVSHYNLACAYALAGHLGKGVRSFRASADRGFSFVATALRDEDLDRIRTHAEFGPAMEVVKKNAASEIEKFKKTARRAKIITILPPGHDAKKAAPLIVAMHGYGADAADIASAWRKTAVHYGAILVAPEAATRAGSGFSWGVMDQGEYLVLRAIEQAKKEHKIDDRRIILTGFSQGGAMSFFVGLRHPELFVGVIPMAGYFEARVSPIPEKLPSSFPRFAVLVGGRDNSVDNNRQAASTLEKAGAAVLLKVYDGLGHSFPPNRKMELRAAMDFVLK